MISVNQEIEKHGYIPELSRSLKTQSLALFGLAYLQPIGPAVIFGYLLTLSGGTVVLPYAFAFAGMIFTILSYSILIREYPLAGSVYHYVKIIIGPFFGFIAGWLLALDYILIPTITSVSAAIYAHQLIPLIPYEVWLITFIFCMGILNLVGIKCTTYFNAFVLLIQIAIVLVGFALWIHYFKSNHSVSDFFTIKPFLFTSVTGVIQASSLAIFSFLGFDAITTLAEESTNPRKDIPRAMLLCACIGFSIMAVTGYLGVLLIPNWHSLFADTAWVNATLFKAAQMTGGNIFSIIYTIGFVLAMIVSNLVSTTAASRLLYGMGRDGVISKRIFSTVNQRWKTPHYNIIAIMMIEIILGMLANPDQLAELINYGAISAFIILNFSLVYLGYRIIKKEVTLYYINTDVQQTLILRFFILPLIGLLIMLLIFSNMKYMTLICGAIWTVLGMIYHKYSKAKSYI